MTDLIEQVKARLAETNPRMRIQQETLVRTRQFLRGQLADSTSSLALACDVALQHDRFRILNIDAALIEVASKANAVVEYYGMHSSTSRESHELIAALEQLRKAVEGE